MSTDTATTEPWPEEIRLSKDKTTLSVTFDNGDVFELPAEYLRVESPSAEVQGHGGESKKIIGGKKHVKIINIEPVGNYAVRLIFDDGHNTGLYSWSTLYKFGQGKEQIWQDYLNALEEKNLSRD